jgi:AraC-like DNA-binding protein
MSAFPEADPAQIRSRRPSRLGERNGRLWHPLRGWLTPSPRPTDTARTLAGVLPLKRLEPLVDEGRWWHRDGHLSLASLPLAAWLGSPLRLEADGHPNHWLLLLHQGVSRLSQGDRELPLRSGEALILPGEPWTLCTSTASCTLLAVDVPLLLEAARLQEVRRAVGLRSLPQAWDPWRLREPRRVGGPGDLRCAAILSSLQRLMISLQEVTQLGEDLSVAVLQQPLHGLLALLLVPEIDNGGDGDDPRVDPLLRYIKEHLDRPLTLQLLEERSHYSRRTLHNVFKQRFDCSPMQWIRQQRMALAFARLSAPHDGDSVQAVAMACGYRSLSQFSLDVQRFHGQKPSELLRLARAAGLTAQPPAAAEPPGPAPG